MKHVTIKDVARAMGCSVSTVSRAFNDKYDIHPDTRKRILDMAESMGYRPNPIARKLIKQRSFNIGMIVPEFETAFFPKVIMGAQEVLQAHNYQMIVMQSNESWETELKNVKMLVDNMVDGLIISLSSEDQNLDYYQELLSRKMPIVFFNRVADELNASKVLFEDYNWAFFATEHLITQGIKKIVHLASHEKLSFAKNRIQGFRDAHYKYRLDPGPTLNCGFSVEEGERVAQELIDKNDIPEAIFAASDLSAIGAIKTFKRNGYRIPHDLRVVGFSESRLASYIEPPLTSVSQPTTQIGKTAAELLIKEIENEVSVPQTVLLNGRLNVRASSMPSIQA
ncbi:LacI family DNA-binding transcriptional regulator [Marinoscillum furvescens]|uniref:LacI family transcriptional regulator n=1 Tax=Marinoscillum furvescens DSM 4134 TaxID=1122208 RepID=A0A3D9L2R1_MARFU|nr:LacI family DNA-binding transcriptional regulator [Marinoscillum furvescens]RED95982.1 LacI family transcriptional regulator [Marinoscillum furvescens DSM 4134]